MDREAIEAEAWGRELSKYVYEVIKKERVGMTDEQREQLRIGLEQEASRAALRIRENFRALQPQPCTRFLSVGTVGWIAKLMEETNGAIQKACIISQLEQTNGKAPCEAMNEVLQNARERFAMGLTDVVHVCVSWLNAEGWNEEARGELHRLVNEKNRARGCL